VNKTKIEWVKNPDGTQGYTWNPITGCLNGCEYCYARKLANGRLRTRYLANKNLSHDYLELKKAFDRNKLEPFQDPFYPRFWEDRLERARTELYNSKPRGIFVCDMSDLFGIGIPKEWDNQVMSTMEERPQHRFYLLTKQPQNLPQWSPFPDNYWVGVTATDHISFSEANHYLMMIEARVKYISFEPLLNRIFLDADMVKVVNQVIIGAQTKPYKPPKIEWVQEIVSACDKAGVAIFLKDNLKPILPTKTPFYKGEFLLSDITPRIWMRQELPDGT